MTRRAYVATIWLLLAAVWTAAAAPPQVSASISADSIMIGDRFSIEVMVDKDIMQVIALPSLGQEGTSHGLEILSESPLDTIKAEGRRQVLHKRYDMTSFEAGNYDLGRFPVLYGDKNITDTIYSPEALRIVVETFPVDTEKDTIYDIKPPIRTPLLVSEFGGYTVAALVAALAVAAAAVLTRRALARRSRPVTESGTPPPSIPPHVRAIEDLEELHNQKLWQSGRTKHYYTRLTDIIRTYLNGRYGMNAMEMTSDEIIRAAAPLDISAKDTADLRSILLTADLVKFAKHDPDREENERLYYAAYYFVEDTKEMPEAQAQQDGQSGEAVEQEPGEASQEKSISDETE